MYSNKNIQPVLTILLLFFPAIAFAGTSNPHDTNYGYNMTLISLVCLMLILLFVIGVLANVLRQLTFIITDKIHKDKQAASDLVKTILLVIVFSIPALQATAKDIENLVTAAPVSISGIPENDFYAIMVVIALELTMIFALVIYIKQLIKVISKKPELVKAAAKIAKKSWFWDKLNAAAPIEKEKDLLLDHDYDGIQELDNSLPPWWKYGFYLTIIVAVIYLYRFHVSHDGQSQYDEYVTEMKQGEEKKAAYLAQSANNVDENTVVLLTSASEIGMGKELFIKTCAPCHVADGGGNVGPNLTDEYWLHGGGIKDIFKSIKYGWQDKGMKSWKDDFSPKQIQQLASFVKSLKGTHPAVAKAPQGDLYIEDSQGAKTFDSTSANAEKVVQK